MADIDLQHMKRTLRTWIDILWHNQKDLRHASADERLSLSRPCLVSLVVPTLCKGYHAHRIASLRALLEKYLPDQSYEHYEALVVSDGPNAAVEDLVHEAWRSSAELPVDCADIRLRWVARDQAWL